MHIYIIYKERTSPKATPETYPQYAGHCTETWHSYQLNDDNVVVKKYDACMYP